MEETGDGGAQEAATLFSQTSVCDTCGLQSKYRCPRCSLRSCSLRCSQQHKIERGCNGERDKTAYIPMKDYKHMDLLNDYALLESTKRQVEEVGKSAPNQHQQHQQMKAQRMQQTYANEGIQLLVSPLGMDRRRRDHTHFDNKLNQLKLSVQIVTPEKDIINHQIPQSSSIRTVLETAGCIMTDSPTFVYVKSHDGRNVETQQDEELIEALRGTTVIDFPILVVSTSPLDARWRTAETMALDSDSSDSDSDSDSDTSSVSSDSSDELSDEGASERPNELIIEIN
ncbi:hypothetical protein E3P99_03571 [Wallemia hederae]|uniref:HIT-type domain-containing protein n=1 Tax=Wallemia hederae TaxID=1540922 RepID=A0A4T0FET6_9BASI|nr:hypothetical protein E3P99_03571 [Wallemia hederae]